MSFRSFGAAAALVALATPALAAGPLAMTSRILVEKRVAAADGSVHTTMVPAVRAVPGDRITVSLSYRNTGPAPIADLVLANPVPRSVAYRGPAAGSPAPEVSVDGRTFGALADLRVAVPGGAPRAAVADDVTHVRWRLPAPVAAGRGGELAFQAVLK